MSDSKLSPFTARDGNNIALQDWPLSEGESKGTVLVVHGLGEHAGRYHHAALQLNSWGFDVRSYDHYGHGDSAGQRGDIPTSMRLVEDLTEVVEDTRRLMQPGKPLVLLGHSMGGTVAATWVREKLGRVDALVLSSPAFDPGLNALQKFLLRVMPRIAPHLCVANGLNPKMVCRDPAVVKAYTSDPLVHKRISPLLAQFISEQGARCIAAAKDWRVPTLLMYAGSDTLVSPAGSRAFASVAPSALVQSQCFDAMYHEILNDPQKDQVFALLRTWLAQRLR